MRLPEIGELRRRVKLFGVKHSPDDDAGLVTSTELIGEVWAKREIVGGVQYLESMNVEETVTHRFYVRYAPGLRPQDLGHLSGLECEGVRYVVRRVTDVDDMHRFTMFEAEEVTDARAVDLGS